jgi:hypothetical protein
MYRVSFGCAITEDPLLGSPESRANALTAWQQYAMVLANGDDIGHAKLDQGVDKGTTLTVARGSASSHWQCWVYSDRYHLV